MKRLLVIILCVSLLTVVPIQKASATPRTFTFPTSPYFSGLNGAYSGVTLSITNVSGNTYDIKLSATSKVTASAITSIDIVVYTYLGGSNAMNMSQSHYRYNTFTRSSSTGAIPSSGVLYEINYDFGEPCPAVSFAIQINTATSSYASDSIGSIYSPIFRPAISPRFLIYQKRGTLAPYNATIVTESFNGDTNTYLCTIGRSDYWMNYPIKITNGSGDEVYSQTLWESTVTSFLVKYYDVPTSVGDLRLQ